MSRPERLLWSFLMGVVVVSMLVLVAYGIMRVFGGA